MIDNRGGGGYDFMMNFFQYASGGFELVIPDILTIELWEYSVNTNDFKKHLNRHLVPLCH